MHARKHPHPLAAGRAHTRVQTHSAVRQGRGTFYNCRAHRPGHTHHGPPGAGRKASSGLDSAPRHHHPSTHPGFLPSEMFPYSGLPGLWGKGPLRNAAGATWGQKLERPVPGLFPPANSLSEKTICGERPGGRRAPGRLLASPPAPPPLPPPPRGPRAASGVVAPPPSGPGAALAGEPRRLSALFGPGEAWERQASPSPPSQQADPGPPDYFCLHQQDCGQPRRLAGRRRRGGVGRGLFQGSPEGALPLRSSRSERAQQDSGGRVEEKKRQKRERKSKREREKERRR